MGCLNKEAMADLVQNGVLSARSDDTKSLKGVGLGWISSRGISLNPPVALARNVNRRRPDRAMLASMTMQFAGWVFQ